MPHDPLWALVIVVWSALGVLALIGCACAAVSGGRAVPQSRRLRPPKRRERLVSWPLAVDAAATGSNP